MKPNPLYVVGHLLKKRGEKKNEKGGRENILWNEGDEAGDEPAKVRFAPSKLHPKRVLS